MVVLDLLILLFKLNPFGIKTMAYFIDLETEIDQLVYKLYNLTEEEIAIVESSTK